MNRAEKDAEISQLVDAITKSQMTVCADYHGLSVADITELRSELRSNGAFGRVVKNTLAKRAAQEALKDSEDTELEKFLELFQGPNFVVFANEDPVSPAKTLSKFAKQNEHLTVRGGWFEGGFVSEEEVKALSNLPSREELLAKLLNLMNAPATQLLQLMKAPARQIVQVLEGHRANIEKKGS